MGTSQERRPCRVSNVTRTGPLSEATGCSASRRCSICCRRVDGELVALDDAGRPLFVALMFGRRRPTYVAFDLLMADGVDLRPLPLRQRKAALAPPQGHFELRVVPFPHRPIGPTDITRLPTP